MIPGIDMITPCGLNKMADILQTIFHILCLGQINFVLWKTFLFACMFWKCKWQKVSSSLGNGLALNRPQAITWTNDDTVPWTIYDHWVNPLRPSDTTWSYRPWSTLLLQHWFTWTNTDLMKLIKLDLNEQLSVTFESKYTSFHQRNAFVNIICKMSAILFRLHSVKIGMNISIYLWYGSTYVAEKLLKWTWWYHILYTQMVKHTVNTIYYKK